VIDFGAGSQSFSFLPGAIELRTVPEPGSIASLAGNGMIGLVALLRRRRDRVAAAR
jgi:hypothetical protein